MLESSEVLQWRSNRSNAAQLVLWGEVNSTNIDEPALNDWWTNEHLPERLSIPGFSQARRYYAREESVNTTYYLTIYEVTELQVLSSPEYMDKLNKPTERTQEHMPTLASMNRAACKVIHYQTRSEWYSYSSAVGGTLAMVSLDLPEDKFQNNLDLIFQELSRLQSNDKNMMSFSILQEDKAATEPGSSSESYKNVKIRRSDTTEGIRAILLLQFSTPLSLHFSNSRASLEALTHQLSESASMRVFGFMCCLNG